MKEYVREHKITDILFANNIFQACGSRYRAYEFFLTMEEGCRENPSTAFFKNRPKDTLDVKTDTIASQKRDSSTISVPEDVTPDSSLSDSVRNKDNKPVESVPETDTKERSDSIVVQ